MSEIVHDSFEETVECAVEDCIYEAKFVYPNTAAKFCSHHALEGSIALGSDNQTGEYKTAHAL